MCTMCFLLVFVGLPVLSELLRERAYMAAERERQRYRESRRDRWLEEFYGRSS